VKLPPINLLNYNRSRYWKQRKEKENNMIESVTLWHQRARPNPTYDDFMVQLGCHLEEMAEFLAELSFEDSSDHILDEAIANVVTLATRLKCKATAVNIPDRHNFLKELTDGLVTAAGVAHCAGMAFCSAVEEVNRSNWSKFDENGQPTFDKHGHECC